MRPEKPLFPRTRRTPRGAACGSDRVEIRDSTTGAWIAGWQGPAEHGCVYSPDGSILVALDDGIRGRTERGPVGAWSPPSTATLLHAATMTPIGAAIADVRSIALSRDGARILVVLGGVREGFSVLDTATREEVAHVSMPVPDTIAIESTKINKDTKEVSFKVKTSDKSPVGKQGNLFVMVKVPVEGGLTTHRIAVGSTLRIDKPRPAPAAAPATPERLHGPRTRGTDTSAERRRPRWGGWLVEALVAALVGGLR